MKEGWKEVSKEGTISAVTTTVTTIIKSTAIDTHLLQEEWIGEERK